MEIRRGDILWVEFRGGNGHIQQGRRPCIVVSTDNANSGAKTLNVIPGTTNDEKKRFKYHLFVKGSEINGYLGKDTTFLVEQLTTIDKNQILCGAGYVSDKVIERLDKCLIRQLGISIGGNQDE